MGPEAIIMTRSAVLETPSTPTHRLPLSFPAEMATEQRFYRKSLFGTQNRRCERLYLITRGHVLFHRVGRDGEKRVLDLLGPGDLFGEDALRADSRWQVTAAAVTDGTAQVIPAGQVPGLAQYYPGIAASLFQLLAQRLERAHRRSDILLAASARERALGLLAELAEQYGVAQGDRVWLSLPLTQSQLAELIRVRRETVVRTLADLEAEGLIHRRRSGLWVYQAALAAASTASPRSVKVTEATE